MFLFVSELIIRLMHRKFELIRSKNQGFFPLAHRFAFPASNGIFVNRKGFVGNDQIGVDADNIAESFALGTRAERAVETECVLGWLFKRDAVCLEAFGEQPPLPPPQGGKSYHCQSPPLRGDLGGLKPHTNTDIAENRFSTISATF